MTQPAQNARHTAGNTGNVVGSPGSSLSLNMTV